MTDFETMPVGTAALLRETAEWLRREHTGMIERYRQAEEKAGQADGWRREPHLEAMARIKATSDQVAERIGAIEALLDRSHAAGADR